MEFLDSYRQSLQRDLSQLDLGKLETAVQWLGQARDEGKNIFTCGNGGSAMTASHFATDIVKGASYGCAKRFRIMALTDSLGTLTAYSNDVSYESVFVEQLKNFAGPGDVVMAISGSGNSPNVLRTVEYANQAGCRTIALTGRNGGKLGALAQLNILAAEPHMGRIEDIHMIVCHMIAYSFMDTHPQSPVGAQALGG